MKSLPGPSKVDQVPEFATRVLETCPKSLRPKYRKMADRAESSFVAAIKLRCLDCSAWVYSEARGCLVTGCGLYEVSRRLFRHRGSGSAEAGGEVEDNA